ncbi:MAG: hypothetical protein JWN25_2683 [Verrucomicrobiales bacterium]|nr:hypothetical protein [Verrucomicrobiales bacterium]
MSLSTECDNPVLLGKCHFPVTISVFSKCDIRSASNRQPSEEGRSNFDPKSQLSPARNLQVQMKTEALRSPLYPNGFADERETKSFAEIASSSRQMSASVTSDNPFPLGKCHFPVTLESDLPFRVTPPPSCENLFNLWTKFPPVFPPSRPLRPYCEKTYAPYSNFDPKSLFSSPRATLC